MKINVSESGLIDVKPMILEGIMAGVFRALMEGNMPSNTKEAEVLLGSVKERVADRLGDYFAEILDARAAGRSVPRAFLTDNDRDIESGVDLKAKKAEYIAIVDAEIDAFLAKLPKLTATREAIIEPEVALAFVDEVEVETDEPG